MNGDWILWMGNHPHPLPLRVRYMNDKPPGSTPLPQILLKIAE